jgi:hypothetical protein
MHIINNLHKNNKSLQTTHEPSLYAIGSKLLHILNEVQTTTTYSIFDVLCQSHKFF